MPCIYELCPSVRPSVCDPISPAKQFFFLDYSEIRLIHSLHKLSSKGEFREDRLAEGHVY